MATIVLVPGFWLGAWAWDAVAAGGHDVHAVTLSGPGDGVDAETHVADAVRAVEGTGRDDVVLVGHSGGGPVVAAAAERVRVGHVVHVDTGPLPDGWANVDFFDSELAAVTRENIAGPGRGVEHPMLPDEVLGRGGALEGVGADWATVRARARPHPAGAVLGPIARGARDPELPKTVVACTFPAAGVAQMAGPGSPFAEMADPEWTVVELRTGHWPMVSRPADLAAVLGAITPR